VFYVFIYILLFQEKGNLISNTDQVVSELLNDVSSITRLGSLTIDTDKDGLLSLNKHATSRTLLSVDTSVVITKSKVFNVIQHDTRSNDVAGVDEGTGNLLAFSWGDGKSGRGGPSVTIKTNDGSLLDSSCSNEVLVDVCLPRHA